MMIRNLAITAFSFMLAGCAAKSSEQRHDSDLARQVFVAQINSVDVMVLQKGDFHRQIISNGKLEARRKAAIGFHTTGWLDEINVVDGSTVRQGDVLAVLNTKDAEVELERARVAYRKAELDLSDRLLDFGYGPQTDTASVSRETMQIVYLRSGYSEAKHSLETSRLALERSTLTAPFSGKIADVLQKNFEQASGTFCTLIDDAVFNVRFSVLETEAGQVWVGQPVKVNSFNDPQHIVHGKITRINPRVDNNGQIQLTAQIDGNGRMMDGMNVRIVAESIMPDRLVVPKSAVVIRDDRQVLFRYTEGRALWTYVRVAESNSEQHVVQADTDRGAELGVGDTIIISGNHNLGNDAVVEIASPQ